MTASSNEIISPCCLIYIWVSDSKTCHRKPKTSQCRQHCRGGGTELASENGNWPVQRVAVTQCCFQQENKSSIQEGTRHHGANL